MTIASPADTLNFLALLGEYGTGKTTLCKYIAHELARPHLTDARADDEPAARGPGLIRDERKRIPLLLPLRNVKTMSLEEFITAHLVNHCGIELNYRDFLARLDRGEFVILLPFNDTQIRHFGPVWSVVCSRDSRCIVSGSFDNSVRLWDFAGNLVRTFQGHVGQVFGTDCSDDGRWIVSGGDDTTLKLWDSDGRLLATFAGHTHSVHAVEFSRDASRIVSGSADSTVRLWNRQGEALHTFEGHTDGVSSVRFFSNDRRIVSAGWDATIKCWDADTASPRFGECLWTIAQQSKCKGMQISGARGLDVRGFRVRDEKAQYDWQTHEGTLAEWLLDRGARR